MAKAPDRRQAKSWTALRRALMSLIREKGFDAITVQEILDRADVGRSTFYVHTTGKVDLLRKSVRQLRSELLAQMVAKDNGGNVERPLSYSRFMIDHLDANRDLYYNVVHTRGGEVVLKEIRNLVADFAREDLVAYGIAPGVTCEFAVQYLSGAFMATVTWWLDRRPPVTAAELDAMFRGYAERGLGLTFN
jgi:AcrR family transcriptional regulator